MVNRSRRRFLLTGAALGGGLVIGYGASRPRELLGSGAILPAENGETALNAWIKIAPDGIVTVAIPRAEMGQGIYTALAMIVAEELDIPWSNVRCVQAPIDTIYANVVMFEASAPFDQDDDGFIASSGRWTFARLGRVLGIQATGGSTSVRDGWITMRSAGAAARSMLLVAGAARMAVPASQCVAELGVVHHRESGRKFGYGELAAEAAQVQPPMPLAFKSPDKYRLIGQHVARVDVLGKVTGQAGYAIDVRPPGLLYAAVKASPVFGGTLVAFDGERARAQPGIVDIIGIGDAVIVIADSYWRATTALAAVEMTFDDGLNAQLDSNALIALYEDAIDEHGRAYENSGDALSILDGAANILRAKYRVPLLAHACMEPMNCTVLITDEMCEIWSGNQAPSLFRDVAADVCGLPKHKIKLHTTIMGGGFGRRTEVDILRQAISAALAVPGRPVQLIWSREEDMRHDMYRPAAVSRFEATLDSQGRIAAWHHRIASPSVTQAMLKRTYPSLPTGGPDKSNAEGAAFLPYEISNRTVEHVAVDSPVPVGYWRSVGHSFNAFFTECFMDELAAAAQQDPIAFRLAHLENKPRATRVLTLLAELGGWQAQSKSGRALGVALHESFGSIVGQIAEVGIDDGQIRVHKVVCVIDCGMAIHPDNVIAQMESGILFGLTAALFGEITLVNGAVREGNFPDYKIAKLADAPHIETHIINSGAKLGGVGEPGTPPIAPAIANAVSKLTGMRIRELPIRIA